MEHNFARMTSLRHITWYGVVQQEGDGSTDEHTGAQQDGDDLVTNVIS